MTSANGLSSIIGGQAFPAVPSKITFWTGAPSVFTNTINGAMTNAQTPLPLSTATTSSWGSSGLLQVDQEVMQYTGVTAGLTTIKVTQGQYGSIAQAHSNGASINSLGYGQLAVYCNGAQQAAGGGRGGPAGQ